MRAIRALGLAMVLLDGSLGAWAASNPPPAPVTNGPTLRLDYNRDNPAGNPIACFMYFVPLISPDPVVVTESSGNTQQARVISATRRFKTNSFTVDCEFEITGTGTQRNRTDLTSQLRQHEEQLKQGGVLTRQLDYIAVTGSGRGRIEVKGLVANNTRVVTEIRLRFNDAGQKTPVTIGLVDFRFVDGVIRAENPIVAQVNALLFRRTTNHAHMDVTVGTVKSKDSGNGRWQRFIGGVTGIAANLFLKPVPVDQTGNDAMLEFGLALALDASQYTFPKAKNLAAASLSVSNAPPSSEQIRP